MLSVAKLVLIGITALASVSASGSQGAQGQNVARRTVAPIGNTNNSVFRARAALNQKDSNRSKAKAAKAAKRVALAQAPAAESSAPSPLDPYTGALNCGAIGVICPHSYTGVGTPRCANGTCTLDCPSGSTLHSSGGANYCD
ncbi:hypothetical protein RQP46_002356 [Phenoliferia psychrophenolica]